MESNSVFSRICQMQIVMEMGANPVHNACISNKKPLLRLLKVDEFFITVIKEVEVRLTILFFICQIKTNRDGKG